MAYRSDAYSGGFAEPVFDSQSVFRRLMDAMARPGTIADIAATAGPPSPMSAGAGGVALALCDHDTLVHLSPAMIDAGIQAWLAFHTGALVAGERSEAAFAFLEQGAQLPPLSTFSTGTQEYPDRSTTIVFDVPDLGGGDAFVLTGPGIENTHEIAPRGLPSHFARMWAENTALFPRGVDLILTSGRHALCLPRTTRINRKEG
ncbi:MAG: phosphonate C-P lyase system protein PhnH [Rhizobium sp.]|nr:phosphonate C-P lyase system protein PhnH [Rhizobium sp.]